MTELEILQSIQTKMEASGTATAAEIKEIKAYIEATKTADTAFKKVVEDLNTELKAKEATIGEIQGEVKELKAKQGRQIFSAAGRTERKSLEMQIAEKIEEKKVEIAASVNGKLIEPIEFKTVGVITDSNFTGTNAPYRGYLDWQPGMEPTMPIAGITIRLK